MGRPEREITVSTPGSQIQGAGERVTLASLAHKAATFEHYFMLILEAEQRGQLKLKKKEKVVYRATPAEKKGK